jgi:hypothetical protein
MPIEVSIYPNPFDSLITIEVICAEEEDCIMLLSDKENAKIVRMLGAGLVKGLNTIPLQGLRALPAGNYQLDIKSANGNSIYMTQLIKQ